MEMLNSTEARYFFTNNHKTYLVKAIKITGVQYFSIFCHSCVQPTKSEKSKKFQPNVKTSAEEN